MTKYIEAIIESIEHLKSYDTCGEDTDKAINLFKLFLYEINSMKKNSIIELATYDEILTNEIVDKILNMKIQND